MCYLCIEWEKHKLTSKEAFRAINEVLHTSKDPKQIQHVKELAEKIIEKEVPTVESDDQADGDWWNHTHED